MIKLLHQHNVFNGERQWKYIYIYILMKNNTQELFKLPKGRKVVKNKLGYEVKLKPNGSIDKLKTRVVTKVYSQVYGIDCEQTFAPIVKLDSIMTMMFVIVMLSIVIVDDVKLLQLYV